MIETIYKVEDKIFKDYKEAEKYDAEIGFKMYDTNGFRTSDPGLASYIITTNEAQTNYVRTKYNIELPNIYGFYVWWHTDVWIRVPNNIVEELTKRFK